MRVSALSQRSKLTQSMSLVSLEETSTQTDQTEETTDFEKRITLELHKVKHGESARAFNSCEASSNETSTPKTESPSATPSTTPTSTPTDTPRETLTTPTASLSVPSSPPRKKSVGSGQTSPRKRNLLAEVAQSDYVDDFDMFAGKTATSKKEEIQIPFKRNTDNASVEAARKKEKKNSTAAKRKSSNLEMNHSTPASIPNVIKKPSKKKEKELPTAPTIAVCLSFLFCELPSNSLSRQASLKRLISSTNLPLYGAIIFGSISSVVY